ncbi:MAG: helix-turn-helix transcriptional regulator [Clostridia bacterium]|jgi:putative transcriptional regulator|nr:helix-turn-helix transcriptional regulator [Clostridia bacterium]
MKNNLTNLRKELNFSQEALSKVLKVSRQTIISIEKGKYNPSLDLAFKIANVFNKSIEEIFIYEEE